MSEYEIVKNIIRVAPFLLMVVVFFRIRKEPWRKRSSVVVSIGWILIALSAIAYWKYAVYFAPTEELKISLAAKDTAISISCFESSFIGLHRE